MFGEGTADIPLDFADVNVALIYRNNSEWCVYETSHLVRSNEHANLKLGRFALASSRECFFLYSMR